MGDVLNQKDLPVLSRSKVVAKPQQKEVGRQLRARGHRMLVKAIPPHKCLVLQR